MTTVRISMPLCVIEDGRKQDNAMLQIGFKAVPTFLIGSTFPF